MDTRELSGDHLYFIEAGEGSDDPWLVRAPLHREGVGDDMSSGEIEHLSRLKLGRSPARCRCRPIAVGSSPSRSSATRRI